MRILVIRFSSLGDVVLATAPLHALHAQHRDAEIIFATKRDYTALFEHGPDWMTAVPLEADQSIADFRKSLGSASFDLVVDLHGNLRSRLLISGLKSKATRRVHKSTFRRFRMVWSKKGLNTPISAVGSYLDAAGAQGTAVPQVALSSEEQLHVDMILRTDPSRIGIGWGAKHPTKSVSAEVWTRLLQTISATRAQRIALFGLADERVAIERFVDEAAHSFPAISLEMFIGSPLRETMCQIAGCAAFVSSDSGLMHVADALGVPTFGLFGPTHPALGFAPAGPRSRAFHAGTWCSPCHRHGSAPCFRDQRFCFDELNVESIASAIAAAVELHPGGTSNK